MREEASLSDIRMENKQSLAIHLRWGLRFPTNEVAMSRPCPTGLSRVDGKIAGTWH